MEHDIITYSKLSEASDFFLDEAFHNIHKALSFDYASLILSKKLEGIETTEEDKIKIQASSSKIPNHPVKLQQMETPDVLSNETIHSMSTAWEEAQIQALNEGNQFPKTHTIEDINLLGHITNLGCFIETITNKHLLFLNQTDEIETFSYNKISQAPVMVRLIYINDKEAKENRLDLRDLAHLYRLRNKAVHYTPDNAVGLKPKISELLKIWEMCHELILYFEEKEKFVNDSLANNFGEEMEFFKNKWTK